MTKKLDPKLFEVLACPVAVDQGKSGDLKIYKDSWLISKESNCKYPIVDGIPIMLPEVGEKYKSFKQSDLPVPPPREFD